MEKRKDGTEKRRRGPVRDYRVYHFSRKELAINALIYLGLCGIISFLFFRSWIAWILLFPGVYFFLKDRRRELARKREVEMEGQFLTGIQLVCTSLQAGYAVENAFGEAAAELRKIYSGEAFVVTEFDYIVSQTKLNRSIESLLSDLGERSRVEDIQNLAEVFYTAKRTGGDLMAIMRNTISCIQQRRETRMEIETTLAGKVMEQNMMSVIPLLILGYVTLTSPEFLEVMYEGLPGRIVMGVCLALYLLAYLWGRKIMAIEV